MSADPLRQRISMAENGGGHAIQCDLALSCIRPEIVFVEPQTDGRVEQLEGQHGVKRRCEVLL